MKDLYSIIDIGLHILLCFEGLLLLFDGFGDCFVLVLVGLFEVRDFIFGGVVDFLVNNHKFL